MSKELPIGEQVLLPGHFDGPVTLEAARPLTNGLECRVRLPDGTLEEAVLSEEEATALGKISADGTTPAVANAEDVRLLVESTRIRLAYAHDKHFAVSLSGIQTFPHQIEAVYLKMLPQPRLRFLLADDPGAGKTIMAGLLIKEMKLREAISPGLRHSETVPTRFSAHRLRACLSEMGSSAPSSLCFRPFRFHAPTRKAGRAAAGSQIITRRTARRHRALLSDKLARRQLSLGTPYSQFRLKSNLVVRAAVCEFPCLFVPPALPPASIQWARCVSARSVFVF